MSAPGLSADVSAGLGEDYFVPLAELLDSPRGRLAERIEIPFHPSQLATPAWRRVVRTLPPTCVDLSLRPFGFRSPAATDDFIASLPASIRRVAIESHSEPILPAFCSSRFDVLDLRRQVRCSLGLLDGAQARRPRARVIFGTVDEPQRARRAGIEVGCPGDAALVNQQTGAVLLLPRATLIECQRERSATEPPVVPVRSMLERRVREGFTVMLTHGPPSLARGHEPNLHRHPDGRWTLQAPTPPPVHGTLQVLRVRGERVPPGTAAELHDGDTLQLGGRAFELVADFAAARR